MTDETVTTGQIKRLLSWIADYHSKRLDGNRFGTIKTATSAFSSAR
ncbi:hypothetical protein [Mesorhizobium onobrychidis]|uniref:Uncharacterized protein n=1 Tax=Mesorhizobium onobrychidis TaxID=2775404 RepID=A0ABY5R9U6_9HYPH|nr:hypothetical protein [Mesorhizobium onobrychidis]UVC19412.1 hypothetical protein IHQ72_35775 [Mesorhizobium onobrychidis]